MNFGIVGSGDVGKSLAKKLVGLGHSVTVGTRSPETLAGWLASEGKGAQAASHCSSDFGFFEDVLLIFGGVGPPLWFSHDLRIWP